MNLSMEKLKGFGFGLFMAGFAVVSSGSTRAGLCTGTCRSCCACGCAAFPLIIWMAMKARSRLAILRLSKRWPTRRLASDSLTRIL